MSNNSNNNNSNCNNNNNSNNCNLSNLRGLHRFYTAIALNVAENNGTTTTTTANIKESAIEARKLRRRNAVE